MKTKFKINQKVYCLYSDEVRIMHVWSIDVNNAEVETYKLSALPGAKDYNFVKNQNQIYASKEELLKSL